MTTSWENDFRLRAAIVLAVIGLAVLSVSCERYVTIAPARYPDVGTVSREKWRVETEDRIYRIQRITSADSTLTLAEFLSTETKTTPTYPMRPERIANPAEPLTLRYGDIVKLERIERTHDELAMGVIFVSVFFAVLVIAIAFGQ